MRPRHSFSSTDQDIPRPSLSGFFTKLFLFLTFASDAFAIDPGQLGITLNQGLKEKKKYVWNSVVQFEDNVLTTW